MDDRQLEQTQEERLVGLDYDPSLSWSSHIANLRKKKLFNASIKPILEYCVSVWGSCNAGLLDEIFKVQKRCARVILDAPFQARILPLFLELGCYPLIKSALKEDCFSSTKSWMDVHRITSLRNCYL